MSDLYEYLDGTKLWGDDFAPEQIDAWMRDEAEGYAQLGAGERNSYSYAYHAANRHHMYRYLPRSRFRDVLSIGGAYGDELLPIIDSIDRATIVEPSEALRAKELMGVPLTYLKPGPLGVLPAEDASADLVTCFGVLHHVPNVSFVVSEIGRVLRRGGWALIREPIVSMGDWSRARHGLTKHERGIPFRILRESAERAGLVVRHQALAMFPLVPRLAGLMRRQAYNDRKLVLLDQALSTAFRFNLRYHALRWYEKLRPTSAFLVLQHEGHDSHA